MKPSEHKTVQARILAYAEAIGWTIVSREEAELRCGFDLDVPPADRAKNRSLFFDDLFDAKPLQSPHPSLLPGGDGAFWRGTNYNRATKALQVAQYLNRATK